MLLCQLRSDPCRKPCAVPAVESPAPLCIERKWGRSKCGQALGPLPSQETAPEHCQAAPGARPLLHDLTGPSRLPAVRPRSWCKRPAEGRPDGLWRGGDGDPSSANDATVASEPNEVVTGKMGR
jgi:hypothetical protein